MEGQQKIKKILYRTVISLKFHPKRKNFQINMRKQQIY
jgi:hypothetical protein